MCDDIKTRRQSILSFIEKSKTSNVTKARRNAQDYFQGPRDITSHSRWPRALRMHGSVTPRILLRAIGVGLWSVFVTLISLKVHPVSVHPIILTVLGILVGLSLNLRSSTAYERYMEGRKCWSFLNSVSNCLARNVWIHAVERKGDQGKQDLLAKITFMNLLIAFAVSLKHKLRFEPYIQYEDLNDLVSHLDTFARDAGSSSAREKKVSKVRRIADFLNVAVANPRAELKQAKQPVGNLPSEILSYMSSYIKEIVDNGTMKPSGIESKILNDLRNLDDILITADRILNTPLPIAYTIAISQITWMYVLTLPFQLLSLMRWLTIPVTFLAGYIILGFAAIGNEIENPFGHEVNDLPLELYCAQIASDISIISARPRAELADYVTHPGNKPLYPISSADSTFWPDVDMEDIRDALKTRAMLSKPAMWRRQSTGNRVNMENLRGSVGGSTLNSA